MPVDKNIRWFQPRPLSKYPHLTKWELPIIDAWLKSNPVGLEAVAYDVTVGKGRLSPIDMELALKADWTYLTSLKIDVLARYSSYLAIIELKCITSMLSVGQLVCYSPLFREKYGYSGPLKLWAMSKLIYPDLIPLLPRFGIEWLKIDIPEGTVYDIEKSGSDTGVIPPELIFIPGTAISTNQPASSVSPLK